MFPAIRPCEPPARAGASSSNLASSVPNERLGHVFGRHPSRLRRAARERPGRRTGSSFRFEGPNTARTDRPAKPRVACRRCGPASWRRRVEALAGCARAHCERTVSRCRYAPTMFGRKLFPCDPDMLIGLIALLDPAPFPVELGHHFEIIDFERIRIPFGHGLTGFDFLEGAAEQLGAGAAIGCPGPQAELTSYLAVCDRRHNAGRLTPGASM